MALRRIQGFEGDTVMRERTGRRRRGGGAAAGDAIKLAAKRVPQLEWRPVENP